MGVLKWIVVVVLGLGGVGALGFGVMAAAPMREVPRAIKVAPRVELRQLSGAAPSPRNATSPGLADAGTAAAPPAQPDAGRATDPGKAPDAGKAPEAARPDAGTAPEAGKPDAGKPDAGVVVVAPRLPKPPVGDAVLNLRASDTAAIFLDGKRIGTSPQMELKVRAGAHKVRFDCYDASGGTTPGQTQTVTLAPDEDKLLDFTCPASEDATE